MRGFFAGTFALWLVAAAAGTEERPPEPIVLVVSRDWRGPAALDLITLRRIYLGERTRVGDERVRPLHLPLGSDEREAFSRIALGRSAEDLERYWIEQALQGGAMPPREVSAPEALLRLVRSDRRALGYLAFSDLAADGGEGLRVLRMEAGGRRLAPEDPGYPLLGRVDR